MSRGRRALAAALGVSASLLAGTASAHEPWTFGMGSRAAAMGGAVAALACRRFFNFETVIPCHFGTFPMIDPTPEKFEAGLEGSGVKLVLPGIGETITI